MGNKPKELFVQIFFEGFVRKIAGAQHQGDGDHLEKRHTSSTESVGEIIVHANRPKKTNSDHWTIVSHASASR